MKIKSLSTENTDNVSSITEFFGNKQVIIDGCKCVINYTEGCIELALHDTGLRITGAELVMQSFLGEQAVITGVIAGAEFFGV